MKCFLVDLPSINEQYDSYRTKDGRYITIKHGQLYVTAESLPIVAISFPNATNIQEIGPAQHLEGASL